jgi:intraflagellar transport protein 74
MKTSALELFKKLFEAKEKQTELELALNSLRQESGPQEKQRLLEQVKNDNLETSGMERKITELETEIKQMKDAIAANNSEINAGQSNFYLTR